MRLLIRAPDGRTFDVLAGEEVPPGAIMETSEVRFELEVDAPKTVFDHELLVDDVALERNAASTIRATFRWNVGFHAGAVDLELKAAGSTCLRRRLVTDPAREKLTRDEYVHMVGDIISDSLAVAALAGHRIGVDRGERRPPGIAKFAYLSACFDRLEAAVRDIDRRPWLQTDRFTETVPTGRAGAVDPRQLARAGRELVSVDPVLVARLPPRAKATIDALGGRLPRTIQRTRARHHHHRREHADILGALHSIGSFLRHVRAGVEEAARRAPDAASLEAILARCRSMSRRTSRLEHLVLFDGVVATRGPFAPSHVFRRVPAYRRFHDAWRGFLAGLGSVSGDFVDVPLQRTFDLYETWVFLRLIHAAALEAGDADGWRAAFDELVSPDGLLLQIKARPFAFKGFTMIFQREYLETWRSTGPLVGSFSRPMIPDISIESEREGMPAPVVVLDAKYRVASAVNDAIASIHMYRDALMRASADRSQSERVVEAGFVITPYVGQRSRPVDWRDDHAPEVFFRDEYRSAFRFGAIALRPGVSVERVRETLRLALGG